MYQGSPWISEGPKRQLGPDAIEEAGCIDPGVFGGEVQPISEVGRLDAVAIAHLAQTAEERSFATFAHQHRHSLSFGHLEVTKHVQPRGQAHVHDQADV